MLLFYTAAFTVIVRGIHCSQRETPAKNDIFVLNHVLQINEESLKGSLCSSSAISKIPPN